METHRRSIAKALSWRFVATTITSLIAYAIWGSAKGALQIGAADLVIKLVTYYIHERVWLIVPYGKPQQTDYEI
jgi:uncharacterized membrane protein